MPTETIDTMSHPVEGEIDSGSGSSLDSAELNEVGVDVNVTEDGGIKKKIITPGTGSEKPEKDDKVEVHYVGTLLDGTKFDSSRDRGTPFDFTLGNGSVIKGWDLGVATMKKGEVAVLTCTADYAYGKHGSPPKIPPDATLQFEVELLKWKSSKDIEGDGNVVKNITKQGSGYLRPKPRDEVTVKYKARVTGNEEPFAETGNDGVEFTLQDGHLSAGLEVVLKTMKKGECAAVKLGPKYGCKGAFEREGVPPEAAISVDLELVSWKTVTEVTGDGKVLMKTLVTDESAFKKPLEGAQVTVRMTGTLPDGTTFVDHSQGGQRSFTLDEEEEAEGLELALQRMKKNERVEVTISDPKYGFGSEEEVEQPLAPVPPGSALKYVVELLDFSNPKEPWQMKPDERVPIGRELKDRGNALFKGGKLRSALKCYKRAEKLVQSDKAIDEADKAAAKALGVTCLLNEAAVLLKMKDWKEVKVACGKVLEQESHNVKALYRRAEAHLASEDFEEGIADLKRAREIEPTNRDVVMKLKRAKQLQAAADKKQAKLYGNMFSRMAKLEEKENKLKGGGLDDNKPVMGNDETSAAEEHHQQEQQQLKEGDLEQGVQQDRHPKDSTPMAPLNE